MHESGYICPIYLNDPSYFGGIHDVTSSNYRVFCASDMLTACGDENVVTADASTADTSGRHHGGGHRDYRPL